MASNTDHCAALVREADRERYLATLFAPEDKRAFQKMAQIESKTRILAGGNMGM